MIPAELQALAHLRVHLDSASLEARVRTRLLAEQALALARILGPGFYLSMLQLEPDQVTLRFEAGVLVGVSSPAWNFTQQAQADTHDQRTLERAAVAISCGTLEILGEPVGFAPFDRPLEVKALDCLIGAEPPRSHRLQRLIRKAARDPHLFLRDSRFALLRRLARR